MPKPSPAEADAQPEQPDHSPVYKLSIGTPSHEANGFSLFEISTPGVYLSRVSSNYYEHEVLEWSDGDGQSGYFYERSDRTYIDQYSAFTLITKNQNAPNIHDFYEMKSFTVDDYLIVGSFQDDGNGGTVTTVAITDPPPVTTVTITDARWLDFA